MLIIIHLTPPDFFGISLKARETANLMFMLIMINVLSIMSVYFLAGYCNVGHTNILILDTHICVLFWLVQVRCSKSLLYDKLVIACYLSIGDIPKANQELEIINSLINTH
ncbi:hypothetical protein DMA11_09300 [Marinilabiliaceae bacterium JC017]|nr:hypothetical protein DMA11_09300 [Marinilabiliaceae bacterium JC017]